MLNELKRINKNLHLLSVSARDVAKLRTEIISSLSEKGTDLSEIFFHSLVSALETIIRDEEYHEYVYKRYLQVIRNNYLESFNFLSNSEKEKLLNNWKAQKYWENEAEKHSIDSTIWTTLQAEDRQDIFDDWLMEKLLIQFERILQRRNNLPELLKWVEAGFFKLNLNISSFVRFEAINSTGALYFSWILTELALNTLKYVEAGSHIFVNISRK